MASIRRVVGFAVVAACVLQGASLARPDAGRERELFDGVLPSTYLNYRSPPGVVRSWFSTFRAIESAASTFFAVQRTEYGYFGIQETRTWAGIIAARLGVKMPGLVLREFEGIVIFSIWNTPSNRCRVTAVGDGAYSGKFGGEGTGCQIKLETMWGTEPYAFVTTSTVLSNGVNQLSGYWHDGDDPGGWRFVGQVEIHNEGRIFGESGLASFVEQFHDVESSERRSASFGPSFVEASDGRWSPITDARFSTTSSANMHYHAFGMVLGSAEFSMGVVGGSMLGASTPEGRMLRLPSQPSARDAAALQLFIKMRSQRTLPTGCVGATSCNLHPATNFGSVLAPPSSTVAVIIDALLSGAGATLAYTMWQCFVCCRAGRAGPRSRRSLLVAEPS